jgi:hypothetical protein
MASQKYDDLTPPGRMVWGDLYKADPNDYEGRPKVFKTGPDAGKPRSSYDFGIAIPKNPGEHWASTVWGAAIWQAGHAGASNAKDLPDFSWKVTDGDSAVLPPLKPGKPQGKAPNQKIGFPGHWVLSLSSSFAPQIVDGTNGQFTPITQPDAVKAGDFIQVKGNASYNGSSGNPGVFLNHEVVCFSGYHPQGRLATGGVDATKVGFAAGAAAGATTTPVGAAAVPAPGSLAAEASPRTVAAAQAPLPPAVAAPAAAPAAPTVVTPNASFAPPVPGAPVPPVPSAPPARVMLPAANGATYDAMKAAGWTDEQLVQHGMMQA